MEIKERNAASEIKTREKGESNRMSRRAIRNAVAQSRNMLDTDSQEESSGGDAVEQVEQTAVTVVDELSATGKAFAQERMRRVFVEKRKNLHSQERATGDMAELGDSSTDMHASSAQKSNRVKQERLPHSEKSIPSNQSKTNYHTQKRKEQVRGPGRDRKAPVKTSARKSSSNKTNSRRSAYGQMRRYAQRNLIRRTTWQTKSAPAFLRKMGDAVTKAATAMVSAIAGIAGGGVLLVLLAVLIVVGAVVASPLGILFTNEPTNDGIPLNAAVAQIQAECGDRIAELQAGEYDDIVLLGRLPEWEEVVAIFSSKTAGSEDGVDVMTLDEDRAERLRKVFWDMTEITTEIRTSESEAGTKSVLYLTIATKTADEMRTAYSFTKQQNEMLDELLKERETLDALLTDLSITQEDALELWKSLPEDLSPERRAVVKAALSLVGKVNYFWGGKSEVIGWNYRWGQLQKVTAAGSVTSGTYRPYGLDCSGFVDWVFYNASGGTYLPSNGGGAAMQHANCVDIAWEDAQPGDLVFYQNDEHVGIVGGRDERGNLLVIHCASGANNVVITYADGFNSIARPVCFWNNRTPRAG